MKRSGGGTHDAAEAQFLDSTTYSTRREIVDAMQYVVSVYFVCVYSAHYVYIMWSVKIWQWCKGKTTSRVVLVFYVFHLTFLLLTFTITLHV